MFCSGIGSGSGASGASQASVHGSSAAGPACRCRCGGARCRWRSRASSACWITDAPDSSRTPRSYSAAVRNAEPIHTPDAPSASAAATCRPVPMPPAASTGARPPNRVNDFRHQHHRCDLAGVTAGLVALGDDDVDAVVDVRAARGWRVPASAATGTPAACAWSMTSVGGEPSALAISLIGCFSATSTCERATECSQPSTPSLPALVVGQRRHAEVGERLGDEVAVRLRDQLVDVDRRCPRSAPSPASRRRRRTACRRCCRPSSCRTVSRSSGR